MVSRGEFERVLAEVEASGVDDVLLHRPLADLVAVADAARYAGRRDLAQRALRAQRVRFPGSADAKSAAFHLGRIQDDAGDSAGAIAWYDRYLVEAHDGPLAEGALGRKIVTMSRSSGREAARPVAEEYLVRFPTGPHAAVAREIVRR